MHLNMGSFPVTEALHQESNVSDVVGNRNLEYYDIWLNSIWLAAAGDDVREAEEHKSTHILQEEDSDCPRDSGCFIPSECSDSKEDTEPLTDAVES